LGPKSFGPPPATPPQLAQIPTEEERVELPTISVTETKSASPASYQLKPSEQKPKLKPSANLSINDYLGSQKGLSDNTSCAFCGSRRLSINGQRAEHTTILVDGLSLQPSLASFYGLDSLPFMAIESFDVHLGASQARHYPEALAGVIALHSVQPRYDEKSLEFSLSHRGEAILTALSKTRSDEDNGGWVWGYQGSHQLAWDVDRNEIAEYPQKLIHQAFLKRQWEQPQGTQALRLSSGELQFWGGHLRSSHLKNAVSPIVQAGDFPAGDIRFPYLGNPQKIRDQVTLSRWELAWTGERQFSGFFPRWEYGVGYSEQAFDAIYMHGYDYQNQAQVAHAFSQLLWGEWQAGVDAKKEELRSRSYTLFKQAGLAPDSLSHEQAGAWLSYEHKWGNIWKFYSSLRYQFEQVNWWYHQDTHIKDHLLIPRLNLTFSPTAYQDWGFSIGRGWKAPLTLFESQHGTNEYGFIIATRELELSHNLQLSYSYHDETKFFQALWNGNRVENMSYGLDRSWSFDPTLFENSHEDFFLHALLVEANYQPLEAPWELHTQFEKNMMPDAYKKRLPVAAIEERLIIEGSWSTGVQRWSLKGQWVGARDLSPYAGYPFHYQKVIPFDDPNDPNFGNPPLTFEQKWQKSPAYWQWDVVWNYQKNLMESWQVSVENLFDTTQTAWGDSPLTWHVHGNHYHLDNFHIWGPLTGRRLWVKWSRSF